MEISVEKTHTLLHWLRKCSSRRQHLGAEFADMETIPFAVLSKRHRASAVVYLKSIYELRTEIQAVVLILHETDT